MIATGEWYDTPAKFPAAVANKEKLDRQSRETLAQQQARNAERKKNEAQKLLAESKRLAEAAAEASAESQALSLESTSLANENLSDNSVDLNDIGGGEDTDDVEESDGKITLPNDVTGWSKAQLEDFVVTNELEKGLDLRKTKPALLDEVIAMVQDHNANLA